MFLRKFENENLIGNIENITLSIAAVYFFLLQPELTPQRLNSSQNTKLRMQGFYSDWPAEP